MTYILQEQETSANVSSYAYFLFTFPKDNNADIKQLIIGRHYSQRVHVVLKTLRATFDYFACCYFHCIQRLNIMHIFISTHVDFSIAYNVRLFSTLLYSLSSMCGVNIAQK